MYKCSVELKIFLKLDFSDSNISEDFSLMLEFAFKLCKTEFIFNNHSLSNDKAAEVILDKTVNSFKHLPDSLKDHKFSLRKLNIS